VTLGARIEARSTRGVRQIAAEDFYVGPYSTVLEPDELVTSVTFPDFPAGTITLVHEVTRRPGDFALVGLVAALTLEADTIKAARIGWFGMGPTPMRSPQAEAALANRSLSGLDLLEIGHLAVSDTDPFDDHHATAEYRRAVGARIFRRAVSQALEARKAA
jgi:carbon-monoxide dehydrogenase medium subunit